MSQVEYKTRDVNNVYHTVYKEGLKLGEISQYSDCEYEEKNFYIYLCIKV